MRFNKADIHIHTTASDGLMTPEALVKYVATKTDLRLIAVTDHDTIEGARMAKAYRDANEHRFGHIDVILGSEITSAEGEILALFIKDDIPKGLSAAETIDRIHEQGGLAIAAHPFAFAMTIIGRDGMRGVGRKIVELPFDAVETRNATPTELFGNPFTAWMNRRNANLPVAGGSDTHYLPTVGSTYTRFGGENVDDFRYALENGLTSAGGRIYSPFLIFNVIYDFIFDRFPTSRPATETGTHPIVGEV